MLQGWVWSGLLQGWQMVHNVVHLQLRPGWQLHPRGDVQGRPGLLRLPLGHLVLQGLPWLVCRPLKLHNFDSSKGCPSSCEHHKDQQTQSCEPAKNDISTQKNNNQEGNNHSPANNHNHLCPNNEEGDSQANNNNGENNGRGKANGKAKTTRQTSLRLCL